MNIRSIPLCAILLISCLEATHVAQLDMQLIDRQDSMAGAPAGTVAGAPAGTVAGAPAGTVAGAPAGIIAGAPAGIVAGNFTDMMPTNVDMQIQSPIDSMTESPVLDMNIMDPFSDMHTTDDLSVQISDLAFQMQADMSNHDDMLILIDMTSTSQEMMVQTQDMMVQTQDMMPQITDMMVTAGMMQANDMMGAGMPMIDMQIPVCETGYMLSNQNGSSICIDINECFLNPCGPGVCVNDPGTYHCECPNGYLFILGRCEDIDECVMPNTCQVNSTCSNQIGSYRCLCNNGYQEDHGACVDIDECILQPNLCGNPTENRCINQIGSYTCDCQNGYAQNMNGACVDVNECDQPLSSPTNACNQICINQIGSYACDCQNGYQLDANQRTCIDIDECANLNPCDQRAICSNFPGSYQCACDAIRSPGYYGDGFTCQRLRQVAVGSHFQCVLTAENSDAKVYCWGDNAFGQLGDGTTQTRNSPSVQKPVLFGDLGTPIQIHLGDTFACALLQKNANYQVACWGDNQFGQVGQPAQIAWMTTPTLILKSDQTPLSMNQLPISLKLGSQHACVLTSPFGTVSCWGNNTKAQLGLGHRNPTYLATNMLTASQGFQQILEVDLGDQFTCLLVINQNQQKEIRCVGETGKIQPSLATNLVGADCLTGTAPNETSTCINQPSTPIAMPVGITPVDRLACGLNHVIFQGLNSATNTLSYYAFGENTKGQLGNNSNQYSFFPVLVSVTWGAKQVDQVVAAGNNGYMLMTDDTLYATGDNAQGQLLIQNLTQKITYTSAQSNLVQFEAGNGRACALVLENQISVLKCGGGSHLPDLGIGGCVGGCRFVDYTLKPVIWQ
jgi:alpha-tubulin suppressor-like RCC1 family protein